MAKFLIKISEILTNVERVDTTKEFVTIDSPGKIATYDTDIVDMKVLAVVGEMLCVTFDVRDIKTDETVKKLVRCGKNLQQIKRDIKWDYKGGHYDLQFD